MHIRRVTSLIYPHGHPMMNSIWRMALVKSCTAQWMEMGTFKSIDAQLIATKGCSHRANCGTELQAWIEGWGKQGTNSSRPNWGHQSNSWVSGMRHFLQIFIQTFLHWLIRKWMCPRMWIPINSHPHQMQFEIEKCKWSFHWCFSASSTYYRLILNTFQFVVKMKKYIFYLNGILKQ